MNRARVIKGLALAVLLGTALCRCAHAQDVRSSGFLNIRAGDDALFWSSRSLLDPLTDLSSENKAGISDLNCRLFAKDSVAYSLSMPEALQFKRMGSFLGFLLRRSAPDNALPVPVMLLSKVKHNGACVKNVWESVQSQDINNPSERNLKLQDPGVIAIDQGNSAVLAQGLYKGSVHAIPKNGSYFDAASLSLAYVPRFLGFENAYAIDGSVNSFDKQLGLPKDGTRCDLKHPNDCQVSFQGAGLLNFLGHQNGLDDLYVTLDEDGCAFLDLPNTLLSGGDYINYGFYTEPELILMRDLGFDVRPREFIGTTVLSQGTAQSRVSSRINSGFYAYSERSALYDLSHASQVPLTVGTHVMGSFNDVQLPTSIIATGPGSAGVRIDGVSNNLTLEPSASIIENGYDGTGIAVAYGRNHELDIKGRVHASGPGGTGILLSFPSNLNSDLVEYRGSYVTVRSLDAMKHKSGINGGLGQDQIQNAQRDIADELQGPLVKELHISGNVLGREAAIRIGPLAHVQNIRLENGARLYGGIVSEWEPYFADGRILISPHETSLTMPGVLQLDSILRYHMVFDDFSAQTFIKDRLHTRIFLGEKAVQYGDHRASDPKADIQITGGINGRSLDVISSGGHSKIAGTVNVSSMDIQESVLSLSTGGSFSSTDFLRMRKRGVLNLVNGNGDRFLVQKGGYIGEGSSIRLDARADGTPADFITLPDIITVPGGAVSVEPGLSYAQIRSFNASPREFMRFIERFTSGARSLFKESGLNVSFPKHVWYENGELGMEIKCSSRGCRAGRFTTVSTSKDDSTPLWRYCLSGAGTALLFFILFIYFSYERHNGREHGKRRALHELSAVMKHDSR